MKIVKISDLSEEERKKALEEQEQRYQENEINREKENKRVREAFESNVAPVAERGYISNSQKSNIERDRINEEFNKKNTQDVINKKQNDNKSKVSYSLPTASQKKEIENAKEIKSGDMYKLTNGKVDDRNYFQKLGDKLNFLALNTAGGTLAGTTGIAQAGLTDSANEMNKGQEKENTELGFNFIDSLLGLINPTYGATKSLENAPDRVKEIIDTLSNKDKNVTEKITDIGLNATDNAINDTPVKSLFNSTNQIIGKVNPNSSEAMLEINNKISQPSKNIQEKLNKEAENQDEATQLLGSAFQSVGNMLPSVATSVFTGSPTAGLAIMGASAKGQSTQEALDRGADLDKAVKIGNTKAMIEIGTEMMSGGLNIFGKGALDDIVTKGIDKKVKNEVANFLLKKGVDIPGEILEETISDILGTIIDKGTVDPNATYSISDWSDTAITTTLSTVILNALTGGYGKNAYRTNQMNMQDGNSGIYTDYDTGNVLDKKTQGILNKAENIIKENNTLPMASEFKNNTNNIQTQQTIQQENKTAQNQLSGIRQRLEELRKIDTSEMGLIEKSKIKSEIKALEEGYTSIDEWRKANEIKRQEAIEEYNKKYEKKELEEKVSSNSFNLANNYKQQQLDIINKSNPADDDVHTWIRNVDDIKSFEEAFYENGEYSGFDPDFTEEMANKAKKTGEILVYSSYPIEQGTFVSPSIMEASQYSGGDTSKLYSKKVNIKDVAWIDGAEGQYAKIDTQIVNNQERSHNNKINEKVKQYIGKNKENFSSNINIETKVINENNAHSLNYKLQSQGVIYNKAKELFSNIHRRVFKNNNESIYVTNADIKESIEKTLKNASQKAYLNENIAVFSQLDKIIENAELISSEKFDNKGRNQYKNYEYYASKVNIDGHPYVVEFDTRLQEGTSGKKERHFRLERVYNVNEVTSQTGTDKSINQIDSDATSIANSITPSNENVKLNNYSMQNEQNNTQNVASKTENNSLPTAQQTDNVLDVGEYTGKQRKHYKSIMQSQETTPQAKKIAKELLKADTYVPETNKAQLEQADARIMSSTPDSELSSLSSKAINGEKVTSVDIAVGERLIQYYSKTGDAVKLQEAIQSTAMAGTTAGQTVQAMSLLNHQTPQGQAMWLQKSVDKMNKELAQRKGGTIKKAEDGTIKIVNKKGVDITNKVDLFNLTPEMTQKIVDSKNATELQNNLNEVYEQLGQQVTKTTIQKIDSWRYFAMLANPRTHIRNIIGNSAMGTMQYGIKNKVAGAIEGVVSQFNIEMERTHTIVPASKEVKQFAKNDIVNVLDRLELTENKYNPKTRLENSMRTFKSDVMENTIGKLFELNDTALEAEDGWGLKAGYKKALADYMTANKLTPENITDKQLAKARNYAVEQAKEATFHQQNQIASLINQLSSKNKFAKFTTDAILPFKKTPMNIAKLGVEYSPVGLAKSMVYDTIQLRKKNITINKYIDNVSKGLTGTGIALVGYALAEAGVLKASGSDDKDKESYDEALGNQTYSVKIGDNTYSLDWIAPSGIPLFIGAEIYEIMQSKNETKSSSSDDEKAINQAINSAVNIMDGFTNAMNPMTEMSMLSGLTSALQSYQQGSSQMLANMGTNAVKSYVNQYIPTALGQIAKTTDEYDRSTSTTKTGVLPKAIESTKNQIISKIPGLRQTLPKKTDTWGNDIKQPENIVQRALENAVLPYTRKSVSTNKLDTEITRVYKSTGESSVLPDNINKYLTIDKQKYIMTSEEYSKYKKQYGQTSYNLLNNLINSSQYRKMTDTQKQFAIEKVYTYANEQIKVDYAKQNKLENEESKLYSTIEILKKNNGNTSNYFEYLALTSDMHKNEEKLKVLVDGNYSAKTKEIIYENNIKSSTDKKYDIVKCSGLNINEYLKYKLEDSNKSFSSDKKDDGTIKGKSITNSAKTKKYNYINSMNGTYTQKAILFGLESTPTKTDKQTIVNYITSLPGKSKQEKLDMLGEFNWITLYKDGTFSY